jgi:hypothetical protein
MGVHGAGSVSAQAFAFFLATLAVDAQPGDRARLETGHADFFAAFFAYSVCSVLNPFNGGLNLADQLPFAIPDAQGESAIRFGGSPVRRVGKHLIGAGEILQRGISLLLGFFKHFRKKIAKIFDIALLHGVPPKISVRILPGRTLYGTGLRLLQAGFAPAETAFVHDD